MRNLQVAAITVLLGGTLYGCATIGEKPGDIVPLPGRADGIQNIFVTRQTEFMGGGYSVFLTVNGIDVANLRNGDSVRFGLESGEYELGVRCKSSPTPFFVEWKQRFLEISVSDDLTEFFIIVNALRCRIDAA